MPDLSEVRRKAEEEGGVVDQGGLGVPQDVNEAIRHYKAVEQDEHRAQLALARIYAKGNGVPADPAEALRLYSLVAECDSLDHNPEVVTFAGAVITAEVEEAKAYLRERG